MVGPHSRIDYQEGFHAGRASGRFAAVNLLTGGGARTCASVAPPRLKQNGRFIRHDAFPLPRVTTGAVRSVQALAAPGPQPDRQDAQSRVRRMAAHRSATAEPPFTARLRSGLCGAAEAVWISESNADTIQPGIGSDARQNRCGSGCGLCRTHKSSSRLDIAQHRAFGPMAGI